MVLVLLGWLALQAASPLGDMLARAQQHLAAGDRAGARRELERAQQAFPDSPVVKNFLGVLAAESGDGPAAEALFRDAVARAPRYTDAWLNLGRLYQQGLAADPDGTSALSAYGAVLSYDAGHAEARYQSAVLRAGRRDFEGALTDLDRLPPADQERPGALAIRCAALAGVGDRSGADAVATRLLVRTDLAAVDVERILPLLGAAGRDDLALRLLEGLHERSLAGPDALIRLARLHEGAGRLDLAREELEAASNGRPEGVDVLLDLARVAHKQKDYRGALGYLAPARAREPGNARVHFFFGMVCVDLELGAEAYASLKEAVRLEPENAAYNYALGAVALHRRDPSEAVPYFRKYMALRPDDPRGGFALGVASFQARDFTTARAMLGPAAARADTAAAANYFLARMAREENDLEEALRLSEKAVAAGPEYAEAWAELGLVRYRRREFEAAESALRRCLALDPDSYPGNLHLLMLYERTRDPRHDEQVRRLETIKAQREEAAEDFRRVITVQPY